VLIAIFAVQFIFFCRAAQIFWWAYVKFLKRSTKVCCIFLMGGWGCKSLSMDTACYCQKFGIDIFKILSLMLSIIWTLLTWLNLINVTGEILSMN